MAINISITPRMTASQPPSAATPFPFLDLKAQFATIREEVMAAVTRVMEEQHFILGPEVAALEKEIAAYVGAQHAISCASGSDALLLALMALQVKPGDEVITTPFTFGATAGAIARLNATPVFVDIDPLTYNLDPELVQRALTPRTRALMPVHLFGLSAELAPLMDLSRRYGLPVVEDAAQALGSRYRGQQVGNIGTVGCFSFFPSKNLGGAGDGGMMTTNDPELAEKLRMLRVHGCRQKYRYDAVGVNSRLDAIQAAILRVKLTHLEQWTEARRRHAENYRRLFLNYGLDEHIQLPREPQDRLHVYNQFVIRTPQRDGLREHLRRSGVPTEIYYPAPLHLEPAYAELGHQPGDLPHSEAASREVLALPICSELTEEHQQAVVASIAGYFSRLGGMEG